MRSNLSKRGVQHRQANVHDCVARGACNTDKLIFTTTSLYRNGGGSAYFTGKTVRIFARIAAGTDTATKRSKLKKTVAVMITGSILSRWCSMTAHAAQQPQVEEFSNGRDLLSFAVSFAHRSTNTRFS
jgi:hypothetical protein